MYSVGLEPISEGNEAVYKNYLPVSIENLRGGSPERACGAVVVDTEKSVKRSRCSNVGRTAAARPTQVRKIILEEE